MQNLEWKTIDKTEWGPGEWQTEPDKKQWLDEETGLPCLAVRNGGSGNWCGYVGVSEGHPFFDVNYCECPQSCDSYSCGHARPGDLDVHGGLTFSGFCAKTEDPSTHICHLVEPGENDHVFWLGFDCAHGGDLSPGYAKMNKELGLTGWHGDTYKALDYVESQAKSLARQLKGIENDQHRKD